jgi:hypothetical protein
MTCVYTDAPISEAAGARQDGRLTNLLWRRGHEPPRQRAEVRLEPIARHGYDLWVSGRP